MQQLVNFRVKCNEPLAEHETIQVWSVSEECYVGLMGILNGLFGIDENGWGFIAAVFDDDSGKLTGFKKLEK